MSPKYSKIHNDMPVKTFRAFAYAAHFRFKTRQIWKFTTIICQIWVTAEVGLHFCNTLTFAHIARENEGGKCFQIIGAAS